LIMNKYRIKATYNRYTVQRKGWFFWSNCLKEYCREGSSFPKTFFNYADAKAALETRLKSDAEFEEYKQKVAAFNTRYYYPPLPDEEPVND
jgi:hypothetical protein